MSVKGHVVGGGWVQGDGTLMPVIADTGPGGTDGTNGNNGWTPVLAGEADGVRTLIKVIDWTGGQGTKPTTGMYLGTTGYVTTKAAAFNFNAAKRVIPFSSGPTNASGVAQISFAGAGFVNPPAVVTLPATTTALSGATSTTVSSVTKDGCTVTIRGAALLTGAVTFLVGAIGNVLAIEQ